MATKGIKLSEEHKKKISIAHIGKHHSEETKLKMSKPRSGWVHAKGFCCTEEARYKMSIAKMGDKNSNWRGGKKRNMKGYVYIYSFGHPFADVHNYVFEHRLVMEEFLGRYLLPEEVIHHLNGIKDDNHIENLMLFSNNKEHSGYHVEFKKIKKDLT